MRPKFLFPVVLVLVVSALAGAPMDGDIDLANVYVPPSPASPSNSVPWGYSATMRTQTLYLGSEIGRTGPINTYAWYVSGAAQTFTNVTVFFCTTSVTALSASDFDANYGGATPVAVYPTANRVTGNGTVHYDSIVFLSIAIQN